MSTHPDLSVFDRFKDASGQPRMVRSAVLFIDVLGTSEEACSPAERRDPYLRRLVSAMSRARKDGMLDSSHKRVASTYFTDNIACAFPVETIAELDEAMSILPFMAARYLAAMAIEGVLARGAIAFGDHYADADTAFGPAVVEAVRLEKATSYPRVALSEYAVKISEELASRQYDHSKGPFGRNLVRDVEGTVFVNTLQCLSEDADSNEAARLVSDHRKAIDALREQTTPLAPAVRDKVSWLAAYHDWFCSEWAPEHSALACKSAVQRSFAAF